METTFTAGFIGLGLIDGSIARALKKYYPDVQILAHTRSRHTTEYALEHGIIDEICDTVDERYHKCDYIFLCAPVECNASYLGLLKPYLKKGCILTDVGSTKTNIHKKVEELGLEEKIMHSRKEFQMSKVKYNRIVLKLSGEALAGEKGFGINPPVIKKIAEEIKQVCDLGVQVCIVCGGGNMWRGVTGEQMGMERAQADYIGMLGTIMNGLSLQDALESVGVPTRVQTAIEMRQIAEPYIRRKAIRHLEKGRVVIFSAGTGSPYFSTDTTAALRAAEMDADAILMAKNGVDGVYSADPNKVKDAVKFDHLTHMDILDKHLQVMDSTASSLSMDNHIPLVVFNLNTPGNIVRVVKGEEIGTTIEGE